MFKIQLNFIFLIVLIITTSSFAKNLSRNKLKVSTQDTCTQGFGFTGYCPNLYNGLDALLSGNAKTVYENYLLPILTVYDRSMQFCLGDFTTSQIQSDYNLSLGGCDNMPFVDSGKYGIAMAYVDNVPCGTPQTVATCIGFDNCGTVMITLSGGTVQCVATYASSGVAAIISPLAEIVDSVSIGFSVNRRFTLTYTLSYLSGSDIVNKSVTAKGQFYFGLNLGLPFNYKIAGKSLSDIVQIQAECDQLIDFGDAYSTVSSLIPLITNPSSTNAKTALSSILNNGAESTIIINSVVVLKLEDLTNGLLPDMSLTLQQTNLLISNGTKGSTGLNTGIYLYIHSDIIEGIDDLMRSIFDRFNAILGDIGVSKPSIPSADISLGMFIGVDGVGFKFTIPGYTVTCRFNYSTLKGTCGFLNKFFTAIINGTKFVFKKATAFFDETGDDIVDFVNDTGKLAENLTNAVAKKASSVVSTVTNVAKKTVSVVKKAFKKW